MAVDTILSTATPLQSTPPSALRNSDGIHDRAAKDNRLAGNNNIVSSKPVDKDGDDANCKTIKSASISELPDKKPNQKSYATTKSLKPNKENNNAKSEKVKEPGIVIRNNKTNTRPSIITKSKDSEKNKNIKAVKENETDNNENKPKENSGDKVVKNTKSPHSKWGGAQEDGGSSDDSSTEYVTFEEYLDKTSNGKAPERKHCFNNASLPLPIKPSSSSSSISSISTININESPPTPDVENSTFDAKIFRTSLLEASELPPHEIVLQYFFKEKDLDYSHVCAWSPSTTTSTQITNVPKLTSKRLQYQQNNNNNNNNMGYPSRTLSQSQREDNVNNSFTVPAVYDRLASIGRYQEFCFEHHPDDWQWYMKEYNASHTVGRVGVRRKKKQLKFGVNVPDPYATMGKKVVTSSNLDSRQNTFINHGESCPPKERQPKKIKNGEEVTTSCPGKEEDAGTRKDKNYPVLAPTRDANPVNTNASKSTKSEKPAAKTAVSDAKEKQQNASGSKNKSNNNNYKINKGNNRSHQHQPAKPHPQTSHAPRPNHPGMPQLSGDDVKLSLTSSKISHQKDVNENNDENINEDGNNEEEEDEEEKLWQNPFQASNKSRVNGKSRSGAVSKRSRELTDDQSHDETSVDQKEEMSNRENEGHSNVSIQPFGSESKQNKGKSTKSSSSKPGCVEAKTPSHHLKAELERENDGSLMVKISVFNKEMTKVESFSNDNPSGKGKKTVRIFREESMLMGKELHEKLKSLNQGELSRNGSNFLGDGRDQSKDYKRTANKLAETRQVENDFKHPVKKKTMKSYNKEESLELQGTEWKTKKSKSKSKSVLKEKADGDLILGLDNADIYPRHRTAYQGIEYMSNVNVLKAKPTIKYMKTKLDDSEQSHAPENKDASLEKAALRQTVLIRSSTVHLTPEVGTTENVEDTDALIGRNVHQVYPLNEWKKTIDQGRCGFIVKSFPADNKESEKKQQMTQTSNFVHGTKHQYRKEKPNAFLTTRDHFSDGDNDQLIDDNNNNKPHKDSLDSMPTHLNSSSLPNADEEGKQSKASNKSRSLYRPKPELPSIKVSTGDNPNTVKDNAPTTTIKHYHFPPIHQSDNTPDRQKALDDLFVSGVNHDRSRPRDNSFVSRKRPVSLDRGLIDDLVRYHTETTSIGFKNQQNQLQSHTQILHTHHPHHPNHHHHSFLTNNQNQQQLKTQAEESPSLSPSVQKIKKVQSNLRPRPHSPRDDNHPKVTSSLVEGKELDLRRQIQIYTHARRTHHLTSTHEGVSGDTPGISGKLQPQLLPDLQHFLSLDKDKQL